MKDKKLLARMLAEDVQEYLNEEYNKTFVVTANTFVKTNIEMTGLSIKEEGKNIAPTIYIDDLYNEITVNEENYECIKAICCERADRSLSHIKNKEVDLDNLISPEYIKENVYMQLINKETNEKFNNERPSTDYMDFSIIYRILAVKDNQEIGSFVLSKKMFEDIEISNQELYEIAFENTQRLFPPEIKSLSSTLSEMTGNDFDIPDDMPEIYVISNQMKINGATAIVNKSVLDEVSSKVKGDYYIIPSSIHECLAVPEIIVSSPEELMYMVEAVNAHEVVPEERLSNNVYKYNSDTKELTLASKSQKQLINKEPKLKKEKKL